MFSVHCTVSQKCIDEDGFCGPGCRSGQLSQPGDEKVEEDEEEDVLEVDD